MRSIIVSLGILFFAAPVASAQTITPGTVEISGVTGLAANRQTVSIISATSGQSEATGVNITTIIVGLETTYYITPRIAIGGLASYQGLSSTGPDPTAQSDLSSTFFGPIALVRLPLGGRSQFVLAGSFGADTVHIVNQNTGVSNNTALTATGKYWLAGGALAITLNDHASFDAGVRYQNATFDAGPTSGDRSTAAGLLVNMAVSLYWRR